jgi:regulator of RNase E activity RraA
MVPEPAVVTEQDIMALRSLDTCSVSNAIETFEVRLRNTGFTDSRIHCVFAELPPMVGFAATARLRSGEAPVEGRIYHDRTPWWTSILQVPAPRIVVLQDMDDPPGVGAFLGDMHAAILRALGCVGYVTNGAVRELPRVRELGLHLFAGNLAVSHAYAHIFDMASDVEIAGLPIKQGDLLHGDRHGLLNVPKAVAAKVPQAAARLRTAEENVIGYCGSKDFSLDGLRRVVQNL